MRVLLIVLAALLFAAVAGIMAARDTGNVLISASGWSMQTSLVVFIMLLLVVLVVAYMILRLLARLVSMPDFLQRWLQERRQKKSEKYLLAGLLALIEGRSRDAEENLIRGVRYTAAPLLNYLCAARAAHRQGKYKQRDRYLELAATKKPEDKITIDLVRSELQISEHRAELALETLMPLNNKLPAHRQVEWLLLQSYLELDSWPDALTLLPGVAKSGLLSGDEVLAVKIKIYGGLLQRAGNTANMKRLDEAWRHIPGKMRRLPSLIGVYTREKLKFADTKACEPLIRQALENAWDAEIVQLYGQVRGKDTKRQLEFAENLLSRQPQDADLYLTLGRLSLCNSLWDKARTYLMRSLDLKPAPETCHELARLHERQGDYDAAAGYYQQGLALVTSMERHDTVKMQEQEEEAEAITAGARQVY